MRIVGIVLFSAGIMEELFGIYFLLIGRENFSAILFAALYLIAGLLALAVNKLYEIYNHLKNRS